MRHTNQTAPIGKTTRAASKPVSAEWKREGFIEVMIFAVGGLAVSLLLLAHEVFAELAQISTP